MQFSPASSYFPSPKSYSPQISVLTLSVYEYVLSLHWKTKFKIQRRTQKRIRRKEEKGKDKS
jgi:hypothetical protein